MKLNILCCNPDGGAFLYITKGWENAFKALGHNFLRWNGKKETAEAFRPHLYLGCSGWPQKFPQDIRSKFGTKVAIHVNPWGTTVLKPLKGEPNINEKPQTIEWVKKQNPDFLYCYGLESDISHMWDKWEKQVATVIPMPNAGDATIYKPTSPTPQFACDVGFIGGRWPYKAMNIDKYLLPVLKKKKSKVYGWGGWRGMPFYKGQAHDNMVNRLFSSAKVCPSVVEPHTTRYGIDVPERMFKVPLGGGFTICDPCKGLGRYVPQDIFPMAKNPQDYARLIDYYLSHDNERNQLKQEQRKIILQNHTYFNRIQGFLRFSGFEEEAEKAQEASDDLV